MSGLSVAPQGDVNMGRNRVSNMGDPVYIYDGITKEYFDAHVYQIGDLKWSILNADNDGWLICDGRALIRKQYPKLFAIIGTTFGAPSLTTFSLPDCRGRVLAGVSQARGLAQAVGSETQTLTVNQIPSHTHTGTTESAGSHAHSGATSSNGSHDHTINDGGHSHQQHTINDDFNNSGGSGPSFSADSAGYRTWNNIESSTTGITINANGSHTHTISSDGAHTHTFTSNATGGGQSFSVMQPTLFIGNVLIFGGRS